MPMENENPEIKKSCHPSYELVLENGKLKNVSKETIFETIRYIYDPEHPYNLEQLGIISLVDINVSEYENKDVICKSGQPIKSIDVVFTPTIPHCSMAGIIGLCIIYQLMEFTEKYVINVSIKENTHNTYQALNKQLSDKDRIFAAFENEGLVDIILSCVRKTPI